MDWIDWKRKSKESRGMIMGEGSVIGAVVKGAISGGAKAGGTLSTPFKAAKVGGNAISGIKKAVHKFDKAQKRKSRFKKASAPGTEIKVKNALGMK